MTEIFYIQVLIPAEIRVLLLNGISITKNQMG